jgi:tetratricopeptide (TPR) repeat protein
MSELQRNIRLILFYISLAALSACNRDPGEKDIPAADTAVKPVNELAGLNDRIQSHPSDPDLYYRRAQIFLQREVLAQAAGDINQAVALDSTRPEYYLLMADINFKALKIQNAVSSFEKAIRLDPKNTEAYLKLSELFLYIKAYPKCIFHANEALKIDQNIAKAYFLKGFAYKEMGDTGKALSSFQTVVELQPENYDSYIQLGNIQAARLNPVALQYYNNALRVDPRSTEALYNRGLFLQQGGETEKAETDYNTILKIDPSYSDAHYNLGYIELVERKNYQKAIGHFTDAIRVNNLYAEAFYNRGMAYKHLGDKVAAEKDFREALKIIPNFKLAQKELARLR